MARAAQIFLGEQCEGTLLFSLNIFCVPLCIFEWYGDFWLFSVDQIFFSNFPIIWQGHEGRFSVYVHASKDKPVHFSRYFINREIRSDTVCSSFLYLVLFIVIVKMTKQNSCLSFECKMLYNVIEHNFGIYVNYVKLFFVFWIAILCYNLQQITVSTWMV